MGNRGFITPNMYAFLGLLLVAALVYGYVQMLRLDNERLTNENSTLAHNNTVLQAEISVQAAVSEALPN